MSAGDGRPATRSLIRAMAKHLPPSAAALRLLDVDGLAGAVLSEIRPDIRAIAAPHDVDPWAIPVESVDAVVALNPRLTDEFLDIAWQSLRPGGRLIVVDQDRAPSSALVQLLEARNYTRILVEPALDSGEGVLMRGEKPYPTTDTLARIEEVAQLDDTLVDFSGYEGRYVHLLVRQTPNKPVWKLEPDEQIYWEAAAVVRDDGPAFLAFTGLPRAVAFMQPAVLAGRITGINKVARFHRDVARTWPYPAVLNPPHELLQGHDLIFIPVDPRTAEAPGE